MLNNTTMHCIAYILNNFPINQIIITFIIKNPRVWATIFADPCTTLIFAISQWKISLMDFDMLKLDPKRAQRAILYIKLMLYFYEYIWMHHDTHKFFIVFSFWFYVRKSFYKVSYNKTHNLQNVDLTIIMLVDYISCGHPNQLTFVPNGFGYKLYV